MTLTILRSTGQFPCIMFLYWDLSNIFFSRGQLGLWILGEEHHISSVLFSSYHIKDTCCQCNWSPLMLISLIWLKYPHLHMVLFGRKPLCRAHMSGVESYTLPPRKWSIYIKVFGLLLHRFASSSPNCLRVHCLYPYWLMVIYTSCVFFSLSKVMCF